MSDTPKTDAIWKCISDAAQGAGTREHCFALQEAAKNGIEELERQNTELLEVLRPLLDAVQRHEDLSVIYDEDVAAALSVIAKAEGK